MISLNNFFSSPLETVRLLPAEFQEEMKETVFSRERIETEAIFRDPRFIEITEKYNERWHQELSYYVVRRRVTSNERVIYTIHAQSRGGWSVILCRDFSIQAVVRYLDEFSDPPHFEIEFKVFDRLPSV